MLSTEEGNEYRTESQDVDLDKSKHHIIRLLGSYSLFTFFSEPIQKSFLALTSSTDLQELISFDTSYTDNDLPNFQFVQECRDFELEMVKEGFIREAPWKESFLPIFKFVNFNSNSQNWSRELLEIILDDIKINGAWNELSNTTKQNEMALHEIILFIYALAKFPRELFLIEKSEKKEKAVEIFISLQKFGLANCGLKIFSRYDPNEKSFNSIGTRLYEKIAHLQEDPLDNFVADFGEDQKGKEAFSKKKATEFIMGIFPGKENTQEVEQVIERFRNLWMSKHDNGYSPQRMPRLIVSFFQAMSIGIIWCFLFQNLKKFSAQFTANLKSSTDLEWPFLIRDCLKQNPNGMIEKQPNGLEEPDIEYDLSTLLNDPWNLKNKLDDSRRKDLSPIRQTTLMYQILFPFNGKKQGFLKENAPLLLTLGNNVTWESEGLSIPYFPPFNDDSHNILYQQDLSLLEVSCCLIFPGGLVVVHPPNSRIYLGGHPKIRDNQEGHYSPASISYDNYWRLLYRLFVRVMEARVVLGMINRYLSDCHGDLLRERRSGKRRKLFDEIWKDGENAIREYRESRKGIYDQLIQVGWLLQLMSENIITPEVSEFSFVRHKVLRFMEGNQLHEYKSHIEAEYQNLNQWINEEINAIGTEGALSLAHNSNKKANTAILVAVVSGFIAAVGVSYQLGSQTPKEISPPPQTSSSGTHNEILSEPKASNPSALLPRSIHGNRIP